MEAAYLDAMAAFAEDAGVDRLQIRNPELSCTPDFDACGPPEALAGRARLLIWPDLSTDVPAVLNTLPEEGYSNVVWQDRAGRITGHYVDESYFPALRARLADAYAACVQATVADEQGRPLMAAVLPNPDGVMRARWTR